MNTDFFKHLTLAARHLTMAGESLVPARARAHLEVIRAETCALVTEFFEPVVSPRESSTGGAPQGPRTGSRHITIEED